MNEIVATLAYPNGSNQILDGIHELIEEFLRFPDKFLTEEDVRSYLYNLLLRHYGQVETTEDGSMSISPHSEVRWYGESGKLKYRSDIVILDVSSLKTKEKTMKLPSKGYSFNKFSAIIEIKLRRLNGSSDSSFATAIEKDRKKISDIRADLGNTWEDYNSYIIILDKKSELQFQEKSSGNHKEFYVYSRTHLDATTQNLNLHSSG